MQDDEHPILLQEELVLEDIVQKAEEPISTDEIDINDAIEGAGYGCATVLYQIGTIQFCCLEGAEIVVMTVVGPILRCEWHLTSFQLSALQMSTMVAMLCTGIVTSPLGDSFGRKPVALASAIGTTVVGIICAFVQAYWQFFVLRVLIGVFIGMGVVPAIVLCGETMPKRLRAMAFSQTSLAWGIGSSIGAGLAYFVLEPWGWRGLLLAIPLTFSPSVILLAITPESPRYNFHQGFHGKAKATIETIYKLNGRGTIDIKLKKTPNSQIVGSRLTLDRVYKELQVTENIHNTLYLVILIVSSYFSYYVYAYATPRILNEGYCTGEIVTVKESCTFQNDVLFDLGLVSLSEPFGVLVTLVLLEVLGRRKTFLGAAVAIVIVATPLYFCVNHSFLFWFMLLVRMSMAGMALAPSTLTGEYMPTLIRNFMITIMASFGRAAASLAIFLTEYIVNEGVRQVIGVVQVLTVVSFISLVALKKETLGMNLL